MDVSESTKREVHLANVKRHGDLAPLPEHYRADREIVLVAVKVNGYALQYAAEECKAEECKSDREIVLAAMQDGYAPALQYAAEECKSDRRIVLAAVQQFGQALQYAAEDCKTDRGIVLEAVQQSGQALEYAAVECKADHAIVLAAVKQSAHALRHAAEECTADREIVMAAVRHDPNFIRFAADELLLDSTFAPEAKRDLHILKVSMLSGRSTVVMSGGRRSVENIIGDCCGRLAIQKRVVKFMTS
eukprot:5968671-Amphidinium_carterae.1